jgi:hypothetical protein
MPRSKSATKKDGGKYVLQSELVDYYARGQSVIFYNHRSHEKDESYLGRFLALRDSGLFQEARWLCYRFSRGTARDYVFILQPRHSKLVQQAMEGMVASPWRKHFNTILL